MSDEQPADHPEQSPYFHALNASRYDRQATIRDYEDLTGRRLIVYYGTINRNDIAPFVDLLDDVGPTDKLDLLIGSPGGDGEIALRMAKLCHSGRKDFRVIVPDEAKSAATILALGAESIAMSTMSDLGPVDPQIFMSTRKEYVPAKGIISVVDDLDRRVRETPAAFEWYAALLADIDAVVLTHARAAFARTDELVEEVLACRNEATDAERAGEIAKALSSPETHSAVVDYRRAKDIGLPIDFLEPDSDEWKYIWRLYTKYNVIAPYYHAQFLEGRRVSLSTAQNA